MNPRLELASLDALLDAGDVNPALVAGVARQIQRIAGHQASVALRRGRRAPMVSLRLATSGYTNQVAAAVRRARAGGAGGGQLRDTSDARLEISGCQRAHAAAVEGDPDVAIEQLLPMLRDRRIERIVDELGMGSLSVAIDRLESLLIDLGAEAV